MMKHKITLLIVALACSCMAMAQQPDKEKDARRARWEEFRKNKHNFYAQRMELTAEQSEQFFTLYDELERKRFEMTREVRHAMRELDKKGNATDADYAQVAQQAAQLHEKEAALEKEYYARFCEILSPRQQYIYHKCELEFQKKIIHKKQGKADKK